LNVRKNLFFTEVRPGAIILLTHVLYLIKVRMMIGRNDACWCGSKKKWKQCHYPKEDPKDPLSKISLNELTSTYLKKYNIILKNEKQIASIKEACQVASHILDKICEKAKPGVTTQELDDFAVHLHEQAGAIAAPLHYGEPPFPKSICTSINDVICHGIPNMQVLKVGDILNIDVTSIFNEYYGDCSRMVIVGGTTSVERELVVNVAYECLMHSIEILKPGIPVSEIGKTIQQYANSKNCSVVHQFVGHGVGIEFHESPQIPHNLNSVNIPLAPGMIFTIEPMINVGVSEAVVDPLDQWTARTKDGKDSAQWEHTVLITPTGYEILTPWRR
jgi:methionyl aminopeptidase